MDTVRNLAAAHPRRVRDQVMRWWRA